MMAQKSQIDDLQLDQDLNFQHKEWYFQRLGWILIAFIAIAALLGVLGGPGPLSDTTVSDENGTFSLEYNRFGHLQEPFALHLHLDGEAVASSTIRIWLDQNYLQHVEVENVIPEPERVEVASDRLIYTFHTAEAGQPVVLSFYVRPQESGSLEGQIGIESGSAHDFSQFIYP
jgi:hypothetical protein